MLRIIRTFASSREGATMIEYADCSTRLGSGSRESWFMGTSVGNVFSVVGSNMSVSGPKGRLRQRSCWLAGAGCAG
jgi:hypothetical protein